MRSILSAAENLTVLRFLLMRLLILSAWDRPMIPAAEPLLCSPMALWAVSTLPMKAIFRRGSLSRITSESGFAKKISLAVKTISRGCHWTSVVTVCLSTTPDRIQRDDRGRRATNSLVFAGLCGSRSIVDPERGLLHSKDESFNVFTSVDDKVLLILFTRSFLAPNF